jgi:phosphoserine phosphatase
VNQPGFHPPFHAICFDCDSTLTTLEGIDELAVRAGCVDTIEPLTRAAMDGSMTIEEVYARRLDLIRPDRAAMAWLGERYKAELVADAAETIAILQGLGKSVHVVSGGLLEPVAALAALFNVPRQNVHAVDVSFDEDGAYHGFDPQAVLARGDGKAVIARRLISTYGATALVGDGVTDIRAREGGAYVVGFGGVAVRPAVVAGANVFVRGPSLLATLPAILSPAEVSRIK